MKGGIDLCQKKNKPDQKRVSISHLPHLKLIFSGPERREALGVFVVRVHVKNSHHREAHSYLDE